MEMSLLMEVAKAWYKDINSVYPDRDKMLAISWHWYKMIKPEYQEDEQFYKRIGFRTEAGMMRIQKFEQQRENLTKWFTILIDLLIQAGSLSKEELKIKIEEQMKNLQ